MHAGARCVRCLSQHIVDIERPESIGSARAAAERT